MIAKPFRRLYRLNLHQHSNPNVLLHGRQAQFIRMATLNPAKLLGIDDKVGSIEPGKKANLILIDDTVRVKSVILEGDLAVHDGQLVM